MHEFELNKFTIRLILKLKHISIIRIKISDDRFGVMKLENSAS